LPTGNEEGTTSGLEKDPLNPEIYLIPEENFKEEDQKGIYSFTEGIVDPNAYQKVELHQEGSLTLATVSKGKLGKST
jgi:hypothetical protein